MPTSSFYNPTRLVWGHEALAELPALARGIGIERALVVTDPVIGKTAAFRAAIGHLEKAGLPHRVFDQCGIDARLSHVESEVAKLRADGTSGVIGFGGGSVMCTAKSIAALAANGDKLRPLEKAANIKRRPLPQIEVPTTAGSGTEVSPYTIVKDDVAGGKFTFGNMLTFPDIALLDPAVLESLPKPLAAISAVDAITHALEALFSKIATPASDALAYEAARILFGCVERAIVAGDADARLDNLLGSSLANMACGQSRLGLAHRLSRPLEDTWSINHGLGVGTILPRALDFCAEGWPDKLARLDSVLELGTGRANPAYTKRRLVDRIFATYRAIGFPLAFDAAKLDKARAREMAQMAVSRTTDAAPRPDHIDDATPILAANSQRATVAEASRIYEACFVTPV